MLYDASIAGYQAEIKKVKNQLKNLNDVSEKDFLQLGSCLHAIYSNSKEISQESGNVANKFNGDEISNTVEELKQLSQELTKYNAQSLRLAQQSKTVLAKIYTKAKNISGKIKGFKNVVRTLNILGIYTGVENATTGKRSADIDILAQEVKKLAEMIENKSNYMIEHADNLYTVVHKTSEKVLRVEEKERDQIDYILKNFSENLSLFESKQHVSALTTKDMVSDYETINKQIGSVVSSMQFQDIVRQQIEHVIKNLDFPFDDGGKITENEKEHIGKFIKIVELQKVILNDSNEKIQSATKNIFSNLSLISHDIEEFSNKTKELADCNGSAETSFLSKIEQNAVKSSSLILENLISNKEMLQALENVDETVGKLTKFLKNVEVIGADIELIAVNAIVKSSQLGNQGAALRVLAESIKRLSSQTRIDIVNVSSYLNEVSAAADELKEVMNQKSTETLDDMLAKISSLIQVLQEMNADFKSSLQGLNDKISAIKTKINETRNDFDIDVKFRNLIVQTTAVVDDIVKSVAQNTGVIIEKIQTDDVRVIEDYGIQTCSFSTLEQHNDAINDDDFDGDVELF